MNYENEIINILSELKEINCVKDFSMRDKTVKISFPDKVKSVFIKPSIDEKQVIEYLKTANHTTIEILRYIISNILSTNTFPTQKQIADSIHKDSTTVCKSFSKLKNINIVYKSDDGKYNLSELSNKIKLVINDII